MHIEGQAGHNDFVHDKDKLPGSFIVPTELESAFFYGYPGSQHVVFNPDDVKEGPVKTLRMEKVKIPSNSAFIGNGYIQHAREEWWKAYYLRIICTLLRKKGS